MIDPHSEERPSPEEVWARQFAEMYLHSQSVQDSIMLTMTIAVPVRTLMMNLYSCMFQSYSQHKRLATQ